MHTKTTRFPNGITDREDTGIFRFLPVLDPTKHLVIFDDFILRTASIATLANNIWETAANVGTPTFSSPTGEPNGAVACFTDVSTNDDAYIRSGQTPSLPIVRGNRIWYRTRMKYDINDEIISIAGLAFNSVAFPANGMFFRRPQDGGAMEFAVRSAGSLTGVFGLDFVSGVDEYFTAQFYYDGENRFEVEISDDVQGKEVLEFSLEDSEIPFGQDMWVSSRVETLTELARIMTIDYIQMIAEITRDN